MSFYFFNGLKIIVTKTKICNLCSVDSYTKNNNLLKKKKKTITVVAFCYIYIILLYFFLINHYKIYL